MGHVLIVEDDDDLAAFVARALETWGHTQDRVNDGRKALARVFQADQDYDLVLCDLHLPSMTGRDFLANTRDLLRNRTPVVVMSGVEYMIEALGALARGALTVLQKPFETQSLQQAVERALDQRSVYRRMAELEAHVGELGRRNGILLERCAQLFDQARLDPLTELPNRRRLAEDLDVVAANARRYASPFALALLDIDAFARFNRDYGMDRADRVLRQVSATIRDACRQGDQLYRPKDTEDRAIYRFGGDEFVLILAGQDTARAVRAMNRVRESLAQAQEAEDGGDAAVTVSIGVAANDPAEPRTIDELMQEANLRLREAKAAGGNCVRPDTEEA